MNETMNGYAIIIKKIINNKANGKMAYFINDKDVKNIKLKNPTIKFCIDILNKNT